MGFILNNKVSQSGNGNGGFLNLNVSSGPYVPNYPTGLSGIGGLVGWYDSSVSSTVQTDITGLNVTRWKNYFNGATQGAAVLADFIPPSSSNYATKLTGQSYIYDTPTGTRTGISFDGVSSAMQLENSIPAGAISNNITYFMATKMLPNLFPLPFVIDVVDSGLNDVGYNGCYQGSALTSISYVTQGAGVNGGLGEMGYVQMMNANGGDGNFSVGYCTTQNSQGMGTFGYYYVPSGIAPKFTTTQSNRRVVSLIPVSMPWYQITLGSDYLNSQGGTYGNGTALIGEILVYNNLPSQSDAATIAAYLLNKWS